MTGYVYSMEDIYNVSDKDYDFRDNKTQQVGTEEGKNSRTLR